MLPSRLAHLIWHTNPLEASKQKTDVARCRRAAPRAATAPRRACCCECCSCCRWRRPAPTRSCQTASPKLAPTWRRRWRACRPGPGRLWRRSCSQCSQVCDEPCWATLLNFTSGCLVRFWDSEIQYGWRPGEVAPSKPDAAAEGESREHRPCGSGSGRYECVSFRQSGHSAPNCLPADGVAQSQPRSLTMCRSGDSELLPHVYGASLAVLGIADISCTFVRAGACAGAAAAAAGAVGFVVQSQMN